MSSTSQESENVNVSELSNLVAVISTCNPKNPERIGFFTKWAIITRACIFSLTLISVTLAFALALLDVGYKNISYFHLLLTFLALILAHASNNMANDLADVLSGVDDKEYARAKYAPHPILSGMIGKKALLVTILVFTFIDILVAIYFYVIGYTYVVYFAGLGGLLSLWYASPVLPLKKIGLGEITSSLVWGPLMVGGTYYVITGQLPSNSSWWAILPWTIVVSSGLIGKHLDKLDADREKKVFTLPVIMDVLSGERAARILNQIVLLSFYVSIIGLVLFGKAGIGILLSFLAFPRLIETLKTYNAPKPSQPPDWFPIWPLWFVAWSLYFNRRAGMLYILGLLLNLIIPAKYAYFAFF